MVVLHPFFIKKGGKRRYDWLTQNLFDSLEEVQHGATAWLWTYNNERPNMALGGITPRQKLHQHKLNSICIALILLNSYE